MDSYILTSHFFKKRVLFYFSFFTQNKAKWALWSTPFIKSSIHSRCSTKKKKKTLVLGLGQKVFSRTFWIRHCYSLTDLSSLLSIRVCYWEERGAESRKGPLGGVQKSSSRHQTPGDPPAAIQHISLPGQSCQWHRNERAQSSLRLIQHASSQ